jgi:HAAS domain-containing protein
VNPTVTGQDEVVAYVAAVRAALNDLPPSVIDELLEDLPEHLAEVQAEGTGTLRDRLGAPEAYASELRTTAGFVGGFPDPPPARRWELNREAMATLRRVLDQADVRVGPAIGYEKASDFLILLRPAWWVLRGYLAAMAIVWLFDDSRNHGLLPRLGGSTLLSLVWLAACVAASIMIGKRARGWTKWPRYALRAGTVLLVLFAISGFAAADSDTRNTDSYTVGDYGGGNPYSGVQDVYVYDSQGRLVQGARLFDQDGSPIQLGSGPAYCTDPTTGESEQSRSLGYPYCPQNAPFTAPQPSGSAPATPSASGSSMPVSPGPTGSVPPTPTTGSVATAQPSVSPSVTRSGGLGNGK